LPLLSQILAIIPNFSKTQNWRLFDCGNVQKLKVGFYNKNKLITQDWLFHSCVDQYFSFKEAPIFQTKTYPRAKIHIPYFLGFFYLKSIFFAFDMQPFFGRILNTHCMGA